jgi:hypothetical protein
VKVKRSKRRQSATLEVNSLDWHISRCSEGIALCPAGVIKKCLKRAGKDPRLDVLVVFDGKCRSTA